LWDITEAAYEQWVGLGRPQRSRFGITVTPDRQELWLDSSTGGQCWPLVVRTEPE
jgi:protein-L-isoaspartate(D-aspartate) O-methyltransferase